MTESLQSAPKLLLVDDTPAALEVLTDSFDGQGYEITTAANGAEAIELARTVNPDLILLDVMMPGMTGFEVCRILREDPILAEVPIILVTALDDKDSLIEGIESGADDFISKPFDRRELRTRVRSITRLNRYRRLAIERERISRLLQHSPAGILMVDQMGAIRIANPAARRILGEAEDFVLEGRLLSDFVVEHFRDYCSTCIEGILSGIRRPGDLDIDLVTDSGVEFPAQVTAGEFPMEEGTGTVITLRNVTEQRRLQEEIQRAQRLDAIGRASAGIAHDFNNVLQAILGPAQLALLDAPEEGALHDDLTQIVKATREGAGLAKQILTFARQAPAVRGIVDLNQVVREIEPILRRLGGKRFHIVMELSEEPLPVEADPGQLKQILTNLIVNAMDAMEDEGTVTLSSAAISDGRIGGHSCSDEKGAGVCVELAASDTGHGMDEETQAQIFEPFFSTKDADKGTGLGLSVVRGIVESHGGTISVESTVGEGTTFRIRIPRASPDPEK